MYRAYATTITLQRMQLPLAGLPPRSSALLGSHTWYRSCRACRQDLLPCTWNPRQLLKRSNGGPHQ